MPRRVRICYRSGLTSGQFKHFYEYLFHIFSSFLHFYFVYMVINVIWNPFTKSKPEVFCIPHLPRWHHFSCCKNNKYQKAHVWDTMVVVMICSLWDLLTGAMGSQLKSYIRLAKLGIAKPHTEFTNSDNSPGIGTLVCWSPYCYAKWD